MKLEDFTAAALRPHVGSYFHVKTQDGQSFDMLLEEVKVVLEKHVSPRMKRDSFSLYFVGPDNLYMQQAMYDVTHDELGGPWPVFLVPVGKRDNTILYEAAFT
jgi:hypothetical protein